MIIFIYVVGGLSKIVERIVDVITPNPITYCQVERLLFELIILPRRQYMTLSCKQSTQVKYVLWCVLI